MRAPPPEPRDHRRLERLEHGELGKDLDELKAPRHAEAREGHHADSADVPVLEAHGPRARREQAREHVDEGGLAGAVGADDGNELALADGEAHAVQRHIGTVELAHAARLEDHASDTSVGRRRAKKPMSPPGAKMTMKASTAPKMSRQ